MAVYAFRSTLGWLIIPMLVTSAGIMTLVLRSDPGFDRRVLWNVPAARLGGKHMFLRFVVGAPVLTFGVYLLRPELWLNFPRSEPLLWGVLMVIYPLWSVYPQEVIFRAFPMHRYQTLFANERHFFAANALGFAAAHLLFANVIALVLSLFGGWLFIRTYASSRSTLLVAIEHALWGDLIFTIGLGWYFFGGSVAG
ncbi:MAG: CPBP family intramembrane metalloprotease [Bacteroidetes bacterium CG12_big_fil_rev_8_21_14_0_65_60_17]|nr:MAG: CPBP family intramembrane metalloprotease [Bacteroidetes bacterium CG12_big_fil_rev_8_21_14_0_65_60_17]